MEKLIIHSDAAERKELIMQPLPPYIGQLNFCIKRNKSYLNKVSPKFELYLEKGMGQKVMILYGVKKIMAVNGYYFIQMDSKGAAERTSDECLGKLRAINN